MNRERLILFLTLGAPWKLVLKESFGPGKENNSIKGALLNHLISEKTKYNFSSILMLQASCIYLGLITPCPETYHPLHPPRRLITPCPTTSVISTKEYSREPAWLTFPLSLPQTSLDVWSLPDPSGRSAWSLGRLSLLLAWIKVTYFCWGRLSFSASPELCLTGASPVLRWEADEQRGQDPEREEWNGRSLHRPRSYSAETREKESGLSGAKGLGSLCKPGGKSASSREMSLF